MKLALVYPPFFHKPFNENLVVVDDEFGIFPHINFGYVAREAKAAGWEVRLFDAEARRLPYERLLEEVKAYAPDLLGFAAHAVQTFHDVLACARRLKADLGLPALVGGYEAKLYPEEIMSHACFDYLCSGEAKNFVGPFLRAFEGKAGLETVPDLHYRTEGRRKYTFPGPALRFQDFDPPDRSIFDHSLYRSHVSQRRHFTIAMSSVGCPYDCSFCCMADTGFQGRTAPQVFEEMRECVERHGIHEIDFFDPVMLQHKPRMRELAALLKQGRLDVIWSTRARIDSLTVSRKSYEPDEEFIRELGEAGCRRLFIGIESGDQAILDSISKRITVGQVREVLECLNRHGIMPLGFFMIGNPGETLATIRKTVDLAVSLPLKYAQFSITTIKPHTRLEREYIPKLFGYDYWREYMKGKVEAQTMPSPWTDLPRPVLEREAKKAYLRFYFRPPYILAMLRKVESLGELLRYAKVAGLMLLQHTWLAAKQSRKSAARTLRFHLSMRFSRL